VLRGPDFVTTLFTQMYFPGVDLPSLASEHPDTTVCDRLVAAIDCSIAAPGQGLGYRFDLSLGSGRHATPFEEVGKHPWLGPMVGQQCGSMAR
jgi:protocatechuate 3,4-dioxygenase beta subunit